MFKKAVVSLVITALFAIPVVANAKVQPIQSPVAGTVHKLDFDLKIQKKIDQINKKYKLNEPFSPEDSKFIQTYAVKAARAKAVTNTSKASTNAVGSLTTTSAASDEVHHYYFDGTESAGSNGQVAGEAQGYLTLDVGFYENSLQVNMDTKETHGYYEPSIQNVVDFVAYGVVGNSGFGKVAEFTMSNTANNTGYLLYNDTKNFDAYMMYWYLNPKGVINYADSSIGTGTLGITPDTQYEY
jgi:hypothetical protein